MLWLWGEHLQVTFLYNFSYCCLWDIALKARLAVVFQQDIAQVFQQCISDIIFSHDVCLLVIEMIDCNLRLRSAKWNSSQQVLSPDKGPAVPELFFRCYDEASLTLTERKWFQGKHQPQLLLASSTGQKAAKPLHYLRGQWMLPWREVILRRVY